MPTTVAKRSVALALEQNGSETWWLLMQQGGGASSTDIFHPGGAFATIDSWLEEQVRLNTSPETDGRVDYITFAEDGSLVSGRGVRILEQKHPVELPNFAGPRDRTAAALVEGPKGTKWYVLVRDLYDHVDVQKVDYANGGKNLTSFLLFANDAFSNGDGLR